MRVLYFLYDCSFENNTCHIALFYVGTYDWINNEGNDIENIHQLYCLLLQYVKQRIELRKRDNKVVIGMVALDLTLNSSRLLASMITDPVFFTKAIGVQSIGGTFFSVHHRISSPAV